jgi:hypothetical protein
MLIPTSTVELQTTVVNGAQHIPIMRSSFPFLPWIYSIWSLACMQVTRARMIPYQSSTARFPAKLEGIVHFSTGSLGKTRRGCFSANTASSLPAVPDRPSQFQADRGMFVRSEINESCQPNQVAMLFPFDLWFLWDMQQNQLQGEVVNWYIILLISREP